MDRASKYLENGDNYLMKSFAFHNLRHIGSGYSNEG
jgi:hypothetical protein